MPQHHCDDKASVYVLRLGKLHKEVCFVVHGEETSFVTSQIHITQKRCSKYGAHQSKWK